MNNIIKFSWFLFQILILFFLFYFLEMNKSFSYLIDFFSYPIYELFNFPYINPFYNTSFSIFLNFFILITIFFIILNTKSLPKNIILILFISFFVISIQDTFLLLNKNSFSFEKTYYIKTLSKFKDNELQSKKYSDNFSIILSNSPYFKLIDSEISSPTLNKNLIVELNKYNKFVNGTNKKYFVSKNEFNIFKDENLLDNNPNFYLIYKKVYEDKVLTQIEKEEFIKK